MNEYLQMDFAEKMQRLEQVIAELDDLSVEYAEISAKYNRTKARIQILKEIKSALQTALKYEAF